MLSSFLRISTCSLLRNSRNSVASPCAPAAAEKLRTAFGASNEFYSVKNFSSTRSGPGRRFECGNGRNTISDIGPAVDEGKLSCDEEEEEEQELELSLTETKDTRKTAAASRPKSFGNFQSRHKIANIAAIVGHGVVDIHVSPEYYGGGKSSYASGFSIDKEGTILTCAHAVINTMLPVTKSYVKQVRARITFKDGRVFYGIVGKYDIKRDVAIVRLLVQKTEQPFPSIKLGESSTIRHRDRILAFGSPVLLPKSISVGIVSCINRTNIEMRYPHLATNTGSSGGPLITLDGRVVGISLWATKYSVLGFSSLDVNVAGLGFGIQIDFVKEFICNYYARRRRSKIY